MSPDPDRTRPDLTGVEAEAEASRLAAEERAARTAQRRHDLGLTDDQPPPSMEALLSGLAAGTRDLTDAARDLYRASVLSRVERAVLFATMVGILVVGGLIGWGVLSLKGLAETNRANGQIVVDCTTPGGGCYERGQQRTAEAVASLNLVTIIAIECSDQYDGAQLRKCIVERIKAGK